MEPKEKRVLGGIFKKVNSGEEKVIRATSFVMKLIVKSFNFEKLTKLRKKKRHLHNSRFCKIFEKQL